MENVAKKAIDLVERYGADPRFRIKTLMNIMASADPTTYGHSMRVAETSARLADHIGMKPTSVQLIKRGAIIHDIGKLCIPNEILNKPEKLSVDEMEIMKQHTNAGVMLIEGEPSVVAVQITHYHHERYDGYGYVGLLGEEIPFPARIVHIADVHDALINKRSYKASMTEEDALKLMCGDIRNKPKQGAGRQAFDPFLLRCFVKMRLADLSFKDEVTPEGREFLLDYAQSPPSSDFPDGLTPQGWSIMANGTRNRTAKQNDGQIRDFDKTISPQGVVLFDANIQLSADPSLLKAKVLAFK